MARSSPDTQTGRGVRILGQVLELRALWLLTGSSPLSGLPLACKPEGNGPSLAAGPSSSSLLLSLCAAQRRVWSLWQRGSWRCQD